MRGDKCPSPVNLRNQDHNFFLEILIIGNNLYVSLSKNVELDIQGGEGSIEPP